MTTSTAVELPEFEGQSVHGARVKITNAGDGLSEALKIAPEALQMGERVYYVLEGEVTQVNHVEKDDTLIRVHTVKANAATKVDPTYAKKVLQESAETLEKARAEAAGQLALEAEAEAEAKEAND